MKDDKPEFVLDPYGDLGVNTTDAALLKDQDKLQILANWFDMQNLRCPHSQSKEGTSVQQDLRRIAARLAAYDEEEPAGLRRGASG